MTISEILIACCISHLEIVFKVQLIELYIDLIHTCKPVITFLSDVPKAQRMSFDTTLINEGLLPEKIRDHSCNRNRPLVKMGHLPEA